MSGVRQSIRSRISFTLVELIVVIAVLLLLMAIALPSFLGSRDASKDRAVQSSITIAYKDAKAAWALNGVYPQFADVGEVKGLKNEIEDAEPQLTVIEDTAPTIPTTQMSVNREDDDSITICGLSASGRFYCLRAAEDGGLQEAAAPLAGPSFQQAAGLTVVRSSASSFELARCLLPTKTAASTCTGSEQGEGQLGWTSSISASSVDGGDTATAPTLSIPSTPADSTSSTASVAFSAIDADSVECSLDGGAFNACSSPFSATGLAVGAHSLSVRATNAGGTDTKTVSWIRLLELTGPTLPGGTPQATGESHAVRFYTDATPDSIQCAVDPASPPSAASGAGWSSCPGLVSSGGTTHTAFYSGLSGSEAGQAHYFYVRVGKDGGYVSDGPSTLFVKNGPTVTFQGAPGPTTTADFVDFTWTTTGGVTSTSCTLDAAPVDCSSATSYSDSGLADGSHTFSVSVVNNVASGSASYTWTIYAPSYASATTLSGAAFGTSAVDGDAATATFGNPTALEIDDAGNLWLGETARGVIRKISPSGTVTTIAGLDGATGTMTDGTGSSARFSTITDISWSGGALWVLDNSGGQSYLRTVSAAGVVNTVSPAPGLLAGSILRTGGFTYLGDNNHTRIVRRTDAGAVSNVASFSGGTLRFALAPNGTIAFTDGSQIKSYNPSTGDVRLIAGSPGTIANFSTSDGTATDGAGNPGTATFNLVQGLAYTPDGNLVVSDRRNSGSLNKIRVIHANQVTTVAGLETAEAPGRFYSVQDLVVRPNGDVVFADAGGPNQIFTLPVG